MADREALHRSLKGKSREELQAMLDAIQARQKLFQEMIGEMLKATRKYERKVAKIKNLPRD
jgi:hypothetical protein